MLAHLDTQTLVAITFAIAVSGYFLGAAMDGVLQGDGFGTIGNMVVMMAGAFIGLQVSPMIEVPLDPTVTQGVAAVSGAFIFLALLATIKGLLARFGY